MGTDICGAVHLCAYSRMRAAVIFADLFVFFYLGFWCAELGKVSKMAQVNR